MDGLSTAASVIAVVQLAQAVGGALMEYYEGIKSARDDVQRLYHSIKNLESVLKSIDDLPPTLSINIQTLLENKTGTLSLCKNELDGIKKELDTFPKQQDRIGKLKSLIWPFKKKDVDKHVDFIDKHKHDLMLAFGVENLHISMRDHDILEDIRCEIRAIQRDKERGQIIEWLAKSLPDSSTEHNIAREKFQEGTGSWLIDGNHLKIWSRSENSFLWLNGGAGAGKSILCSTVIDHIQKLCKQEINVVVTYWYIKFDNLTTQSVSNIIRSWIRDICSNRRDTPQTLKDAYTRCNHGQQQPTIKQLMEILKSVVSGLQDVYLVVDALDEYPKTERDLLLETLKDIHQWKIDSIHIFVTSRAEDDIRFHLDKMRERDVSDSCQSIKVQDPNITEDIKKFLNENISSFRRTMWSSDFKDEVVESVARQADGMFRLAALQLDSLKRHRTVSAIRKGLNQLPSSLDIFYERALNDIPEEDQCYVKIALQWITYTARPLTVLELSEAVVVQIGSPPYLREDDRLSCEGENFTLLDIIPSTFVTVYNKDRDYTSAIWDTNPHIRFTHYSVQEFLQSSRMSDGPVNEYHIRELDAHISIAARSIAYLLHVGLMLNYPHPEVDDIHQRFPLIYHAALCWTYYIQRLEFQGSEHDNLVDHLRKLVLLLINDSQPTPNNQSTPIDSNSWNNRNAWEVSQIICKSAGLKLSYSAIELESDEPKLPCSAIELAHAYDPLEVDLESSFVHLLSNASRGSGDIHESKVPALGTPLHAAALGSHISERTTMLLLAAEINPNTPGGEWRYPLLAAARLNRPEICKLLYEAGAELQAGRGMWNETALHIACEHGHVEVCKFLLDEGFDIEHRGSSDGLGTPLLVASKHRKLEVVKILLASGADTEAEHDTYTALQYASASHDLQICKLLLDSGCDVNHNTKIVDRTTKQIVGEYSPLHRAFEFFWEVDLFVENDNDPCPTIKLLLQYGADIHAREKPYLKNGYRATAIHLCLDYYEFLFFAPVYVDFESIFDYAIDMLLDAGAGNGPDGAELLSILKEKWSTLDGERRSQVRLYEMKGPDEEDLNKYEKMVEPWNKAVDLYCETHNRIYKQQEKEREMLRKGASVKDTEERQINLDDEGTANGEIRKRSI
ncbi:uncharacterized protein EAE97_006630 [Botrytis byssoidea]|uniref:Fungal N-terminal domain-containing protein n=1 Tax=Botrytis byssoidea TaxID=139641 RepID=A0A9P5M4X9_9HELO|nr:uncharacterized protein EAE97_006630 [Botrytis byssoidea]KAF7941793.1 hypothetical protein EAE97_006630 [Botrytis byssoidea]